MPARWRWKVLGEEGLLEEVHHSSTFANPVHAGDEHQISELGLRLVLMVSSASAMLVGCSYHLAVL